jgi:hypothetical protein
LRRCGAALGEDYTVIKAYSENSIKPLEDDI